MSAAEKELRIRIAGRVDNSLTAATAAAQQQVSGLGSKLSALGKMAVAGLGGMAVGSAITSTISTYKDFDQALAQTAATAGAVGEDYQKLQNAAMEAGKGTTKTATEAAQALGYLALAGYDVDQSTEALMPVLKLSEATQMDLARCSDLVTDSMAAAGVSVDKLPDYLDVLCKANNKSNQTAGQLMEAMIAVGGTMKGLNVPIEETSTALGVLANRGIKGAEGGTALNSIMSNLTTGTGQAGEMMEKLGISAFDANGNFIGVQATLMKLNDVTKNLTEEERNAAFAAIGGKEQVKALNALMSGLTTVTADGTTEWNALNQALLNSKGSLDEMNAQVTNTLNGAMSRFGSALDDVKIRAGLAFGPALAGAINYVSNNVMPMLSAAMDNLGPILASIGNEMQYIGNLVAGNWGTLEPIIKGIGIAFGTWKLTEFILGLPQAVSGIKSMIVAQKALTAAKITDKLETIQLQALYWKDILLNAKSTVAMGARTAATTVMTAATAAWGAVCTVASAATTALGAAFAFLTSPIGLTVAAIAAVIAIGVYLYKNWDAVKAKAAELYAAFAEKFPGIAAVIQKVFTTLGPKVQALVTAIGERFGKIKDWFAQKWTEAVQFLSGLIAGASEIAASVSAFITPIVETIVTGFQTAYQWISNLFTTIGGYVSTGIGYLTQFVAFIGDGFSAGLQIYLDAAAAVFGSFSASISAVIDAVITTIGGIIDFLTGVFSGNWSMAWQGIVDAFGGIFSGIQALATAPINGVIALINSLISKINSVSFDVPSWVPGVGGKHFGFDVPSVPALAEGGIATAPTLAMIGEGAESEAIMPLSKLQALLNFARPQQIIMPEPKILQTAVPAPAPQVNNILPATQAPQVNNILPEPQVLQTTVQAPQVNNILPEAQAPQANNILPEPQVLQAQAPNVNNILPEPQVLQTMAQAPQVNITVPEPNVLQSQAPQVKNILPEPKILQTIAEMPLIKNILPEPQVLQTMTEMPLIKNILPKPQVLQAQAPNVDNILPEPSVMQAQAPQVNNILPEPQVLQTIAAAPLIKNILPEQNVPQDSGPKSWMSGVLDRLKKPAQLPLDRLDSVLDSRQQNAPASMPRDMQPMQVSFSPQITIQGNAGKEETMQAMNEAFSQFKAFMARYEREHRRFAFSQ